MCGSWPAVSPGRVWIFDFAQKETTFAAKIKRHNVNKQTWILRQPPSQGLPHSILTTGCCPLQNPCGTYTSHIHARLLPLIFGVVDPV